MKTIIAATTPELEEHSVRQATEITPADLEESAGLESSASRASDGPFAPASPTLREDTRVMFGQTLMSGIRIKMALVLLLGAIAFAVPAIAFPPTAAAEFTEGDCGSVGSDRHNTIQRGDVGTSVSHAQCLLNDLWGYDLAIDGDFGPRTEEAVEGVQDTWDVDVDGIIGPCTWAALHTAPPPAGCQT